MSNTLLVATIILLFPLFAGAQNPGDLDVSWGNVGTILLSADRRL